MKRIIVLITTHLFLSSLSALEFELVEVASSTEECAMLAFNDQERGIGYQWIDGRNSYFYWDTSRTSIFFEKNLLCPPLINQEGVVLLVENLNKCLQLFTWTKENGYIKIPTPEFFGDESFEIRSFNDLSEILVETKKTSKKALWSQGRWKPLDLPMDNLFLMHDSRVILGILSASPALFFVDQFKIAFWKFSDFAILNDVNDQGILIGHHSDRGFLLNTKTDEISYIEGYHPKKINNHLYSVGQRCDDDQSFYLCDHQTGWLYAIQVRDAQLLKIYTMNNNNCFACQFKKNDHYIAAILRPFSEK